MFHYLKFQTRVKHALSALLVGCLVAPIANAQSQDDGSIDEVVVTGSRIADSNLVSSSSVTVMDAEEIDVRGVIRIEDLVNTLPQSLSGQTSTAGVNGAQATVNLRGLGSSRTLVLIDGKRMPYGSPINSAPDLNQIPSQLVKSVEVLTGGATAVYGADAVAGVVNFKMDRDFEGLEANFQGSFFQSGNDNSNVERILSDFSQPDPGGTTDGNSYDFSVVAGTNFEDDRGNITAYFQYSRDDAVRWEDRDFTSCPFGTRDDGNDFSCNGSGSQPRLTRYSRTGADGFNLVADEATGMLRNYNQNTDAFNFALGNYLQRPRERFSYGTFTRYAINDNAEFFLDFSVADNTTDAQIAPSGLALGVTSSINCDNPFLNAEQLGVFCDPAVVFTDSEGVDRAPLRIGRRNLAFPRSAEFELKTQRMVTGLRGEAFAGFNYEVFGQFSKVDYSEIITNDVSVSRITRAIDVVSDPVSGDPVCRSTLNGVDSSCIPFDVFTTNGITAAGSNYVTTPALRVGDTEQLVFGGSLTGDLDFTVPTADSAIATAVGFEFRRDELSLTPDSGDTRTSLRTPVSGEIEVFELYAEVLAPLVQGKTLMEDLTLSAAYRYSDYDTTGTQNTYSYGLSWAPIEDVRLRGQFQRATRSPNPIELFIPQDIGRDTLSAGANGLGDPCAGDFDPATTTPEPVRSQAECQLTGATAAQYGQIIASATGEIDTLNGGNPDLEPELSDTWTFGIVITPDVLPELVVSIDYFSIEVEGFVGTVPAQFALERCLDTGDSRFCGLINRDSAGTLFLVDGEAFIQTTNINTGTLNTSGFDLSASYGFDLPRFGDRLDVRYLATIVDELEEVTLPGEQPFDCAGQHGGSCDNPVPEYRHRVSLDWSKEDLLATLTWRYLAGVDQFSTSPTAVNELDSASFFDLSLRYNLSDSIQLRGGINNLFEEDPPLTSLAGFGGGEDAGRGNTYPQLYDAQGRYIFAGATVRF